MYQEKLPTGMFAHKSPSFHEDLDCIKITLQQLCLDITTKFEEMNNGQVKFKCLTNIQFVNFHHNFNTFIFLLRNSV